MSSSTETVAVPSARRIRLNGNLQVFSLGSVLDADRLHTGPFRKDVISVLSPDDIWTRRRNPALDAFEQRSTLRLTGENARVLRHAQRRRLLSSTVNAYVHAGETVVGFGEGGSESMTIFLRKDGQDRITVRKILSDALTTVHWHPDGQEVMLPPYAKARKQSEYLAALPEAVRDYFPAVYDIVERDIPIPAYLPASDKDAHREVIYEMSYVPGEEVSRYIAEHTPPAAVIARLYQEIFRLLHQKVHTVNRVPAPGGTIEISYFQKIEDRLALCRETAPHTFGPDLLDTERIVIDGVPYLNMPALLRRFRSRPDYLQVLEPRFHSLVMGDTNTENIKMTDAAPLAHAQRLIEAGASPDEIDRALAGITYESLGLRFLDPRAIGFKSSAADTRDDPMYDNKPWHNSIGHYDEIHFEHFALRVRTGSTPHVDVDFVAGNPYQRAYAGMADHFKPVMTAVYDLDNPASPFLRADPHWLVRFVFMMGTHFAAMPPFHFQAEPGGFLRDTYLAQRRPVAIYCEGVKWLNWALELLDGTRTEFLGFSSTRQGFSSTRQGVNL